MSAKARRRAFRHVAPPGIHHLWLAVHRQPHCPSYYTTISFQTDCEQTKETIQTENCSLCCLPRLGDAPFGTSPRPAFTIYGWRYTSNHTARPITPHFPSKLIVNITKETIQTENCSLWCLPRLGDAPFGTSPSPAFTICGFQLELDTLQSIPPRRFTTYLAGSGRPTRGAHRLSCCLLALCSSHPGCCRPYLQKKLVRCKSERTFVGTPRGCGFHPSNIDG